MNAVVVTCTRLHPCGDREFVNRQRIFCSTSCWSFELKKQRWAGDYPTSSFLEFKNFTKAAIGKPIVYEQAPRNVRFSRALCPVVARVLQVWDDNECLVQLSHVSAISPLGKKDLSLAIITNVPQEKQRDGENLQLGHILVNGTRAYESATGKRTVFELTLVDSKDFEKRMQEAASRIELPEQAERSWSDDTGSFSVNGKLLAFDGKTVKIKLESGREVELPLSRLSKADREFVELALGLK